MHSNVIMDEFKPCLPFMQNSELADSSEEDEEEEKEERRKGIWGTAEYVLIDCHFRIHMIIPFYVVMIV